MPWSSATTRPATSSTVTPRSRSSGTPRSRRSRASYLATATAPTRSRSSRRRSPGGAPRRRTANNQQKRTDMITQQIAEVVREDEVLRSGQRIIIERAVMPEQVFLPGPQTGRLSSKEGQQLAAADYEGWGGV